MTPALQNAVGRPGSYLITGPSEARIMQEADAFLMPVFCEHGTGCGTCGSCQSYKERQHPDLLMLEGAGRMEQAGRVPPFLAKRPFGGRLKAVLIPRMDLMNEPAQNAMLKSVEEPPPDTLIVLGAVNLKAVLPTVQSRCIRAEAAPDTENALARLMEACSLPKEQAALLLGASGGDFLGAKRLHDSKYFEVRAKVQEAMSRLLFIRSKATSRVENLLSGNDTLPFTIEVALMYLTDVMRFKYLGDAAPLLNPDLREQIASDARISARRLTRVTAELHDLAERLAVCMGLNRSLALTAALLNIVEDVT